MWRFRLCCPFVIIFCLACGSPLEAGGALRVLEVGGEDLVIEGSSRQMKPGDRFKVLDYEDKQIAVVEIISVKVFENRIECRCKKVHGHSDILPGYKLVSRPEVIGALFVEYSHTQLSAEVNSTYYAITGTTPDAGKGTRSAITIGCFARTPGWGVIHGYAATSYVDLDAIKVWEALQIGALVRPYIKREVAYVSAGGAVGVGIPFGKIKWARPDGEYKDAIGRNAGDAKIQTVGGNVMAVYHLWAGATVNLSTSFGLQVKVGYRGTLHDKFVDSEVADGASEDEWIVREDWLASRIDDGGLTVGIAFLMNASNAKFGSWDK